MRGSPLSGNRVLARMYCHTLYKGKLSSTKWVLRPLCEQQNECYALSVV